MKIVALACLILLGISCTTVRADSPAERIKERFVAAIGQQWQEGSEIREFRLREDRRELFRRRLELPPKAIERFKEYSYSICKPFSESGYDLTVLDMDLAASTDFTALEQRDTLKSKVLARTVVLRRERRVLVVFSESSLVPQVKQFMDALAKWPPEEIWSTAD